MPKESVTSVRVFNRNVSKRALTAVIVAILAGIGILGVSRLISKLPPSQFAPPSSNANCVGVWTDDFLPDYLSARSWRDGGGMYGSLDQLANKYFGPGASCQQYFPPGLRNSHPPLFIVLITPLSFLRYHQARFVWLLLEVCALVGAIALLCRRLGMSWWLALGIGLATLAIPIVETSLSLGQSNEMLVLALVLGWSWLLRRRDRESGIALGVIAALRIFPLFMLIPLIRMKRFKAVRVTCVSFLAASIVGGLAAGVSAIDDFFRLASPFNLHFWIAQPQNISLAGAVSRWLLPNPWFHHGVDMPLVAYGLSGTLILAGILTALLARPNLTGDRFWAAVPWMILVSPLSWTHYLVAVIPVIILVISNAVRITRPPPVTWMLGAAAVLVGILPVLPTHIGQITVLTEVFGYGLPLYGLLFMGVTEVISNRDLSLTLDPK